MGSRVASWLSLPSGTAQPARRALRRGVWPGPGPHGQSQSPAWHPECPSHCPALPRGHRPGDTELRSVLLVILAAPPPLFLRPSTSGGRGLTETRVLSDPPPAPFSLWGFFRDSGPPQGASPAFGLCWVSASIVPACAPPSGNGLRAPVPAIPSRLSHSPVSPRDYGV